MNTWHTYSLMDGVFTGNTIAVQAAFLDANIPDGQGCVIGEFDTLSQRVDIATGLVIDYQPPQPSENHAWDADIRRWVYMPTLADKKAARLAEINTRCAALLDEIGTGYPTGEVQSWSKQEAEARALAISSAAPVPLLSALSLARGVPLTVLAAKVIAKADQFASASGAIIGTRQRCEDLINAAATPDEVAAITWQSA